MSDALKKTAQPDRSKIAMSEEHEVKYWTKHLRVTRESYSAPLTKLGIQPQRRVNSRRLS